MNGLEVRVDATAGLALFAALSDNMPTARTWALNRTAEDVTRALRTEAQSRFIFRQSRSRVLYDYAPVVLRPDQRARNNKPYATPVDPANAGKILRPFETGKPKGPSAVSTKSGVVVKYPAIPTKAIRPWPRASIPSQYHLTNLYPQLRQGQPRTQTGKGQRKPRPSKSWQAVRPFILDPAKAKGLNPKAWGVYQRTGPGRGDIRMLWAFRHQVKRPKLLDTYLTSRRVVNQRWQANMAGAFRHLVRLGKGRSSLLDLAA